jgi:hypothetical protein
MSRKGRKRSKETCRKLSESLKRYYAEHPKRNSPETGRRISEGLLEYYKTHQGHAYWRGKKQSAETSMRKSISLKRYYNKHVVWNKGKEIHSETARKRISESCKRSKVGKLDLKHNDKEEVVSQDIDD